MRSDTFVTVPQDAMQGLNSHIREIFNRLKYKSATLHWHPAGLFVIATTEYDGIAESTTPSLKATLLYPSPKDETR